jgi:hypothetical protein
MRRVDVNGQPGAILFDAQDRLVSVMELDIAGGAVQAIPFRRESGELRHYLGPGRNGLSASSREGATVILLGGPPFPETILMWWNFVARTAGEIEQAREDWEQHRRFGDVKAYRGPRTDAPPLVLR